MSSHFRPGSQPEKHDIRVIEHDGKRWLQQYRTPPDGDHWPNKWIDVAELPWPPSNVNAVAPS